MSAPVSTKPVPVPDAASAPFFAGALAGRLMLLRCPDCGTFQSPTAYLGVPVRPRCLRCFAAPLEWAASSGQATLYSFVVMHQLYDEAFAAEIPYNIAVVETEEGVRLTSQVVDCARGELEIGMELEVVFEQLGDDVAIPKFRPRR
ncbi:MAG TPA: OB-fold domain-containing protein [Solirubrobacteraceae bacterium]|nr:OB-fold domain-containing protein [Solirubrobacteraceae bacterium]